MTEQPNSLHKYAMQFGTYMGLFWIAKFILVPLGVEIPFLQIPFLILTLAVPFLGYYYARMFRDRVCGGNISFLQAWLFTLFMYMFAAILAAVAHYIYFRFIDHGLLYDTYYHVIQEYKKLDGQETQELWKQIEEALGIWGSFSPIELIFQMISSNVFYGSILAIPTALLVMKKKKSTPSNI